MPPSLCEMRTLQQVRIEQAPNSAPDCCLRPACLPQALAQPEGALCSWASVDFLRSSLAADMPELPGDSLLAQLTTATQLRSFLSETQKRLKETAVRETPPKDSHCLHSIFVVSLQLLTTRFLNTVEVILHIFLKILSSVDLMSCPKHSSTSLALCDIIFNTHTHTVLCYGLMTSH